MMPGNMNNILKQAQKMQENMQKMQEELETEEVEASVGGGAVTVKVNGKKEVVDITIKPEVVDPEDIEMLQDLVLSAVNEALRSVDDMQSSQMNKVTGGMNIPGLLDANMQVYTLCHKAYRRIFKTSWSRKYSSKISFSCYKYEY